MNKEKKKKKKEREKKKRPDLKKAETTLSGTTNQQVYTLETVIVGPCPSLSLTILPPVYVVWIQWDIVPSS